MLLNKNVLLLKLSKIELALMRWKSQQNALSVLIESGFTSEIVLLPGQRADINLSRVWKILLYSLQIPVDIWDTWSRRQSDRSHVPVGQGLREADSVRTRTLRRHYEKDQLYCSKLF